MNLEKVAFGFFVVLSLTLNFGFFLGDIDNVKHHNELELFIAIVVNLVAAALKFGDRSQVGAVLLATSLVAILELLAAAIYWMIAVHISLEGLTPAVMSSIVSLSGGALLANIISAIILVSETLFNRS